jgi:hypothetical protein
LISHKNTLRQPKSGGYVGAELASRYTQQRRKVVRQMSKYKSTNYPGARYREHTTRKHGIKPDQYFFIRYQKDGKRKEEGVGWASEGWSPSKVALKLAELKAEANTGEGESRLSDVRAKVEAEKQEEQARQEQEEKDNISLSTYFDKIYYPAIIQAKKTKTALTEEQLFRLWIKTTMGDKPLKEKRFQPLTWNG